MAEGVTPEPGSELEPTRKAELESARSKELQKYSPPLRHGHETKFRFTYGVLAGVGIAALAAAGIFLAVGKPPKPPAWSSWKPTASGDQALLQIANHIAPAYRLPTGEQLVAIQGGPQEFAGLPTRIVLLRTRSDFSLVEGKSAVFTLSGLGKYGSITFGKPSTERTLLLRREALELSLYTFRYVKDVKQVVVILPPAPKHLPSQAMFFRKDDVKPQLKRPLTATLPPKPPSITSLRGGRMSQFLDRMTRDEVYNFDVQPSPDANVLLELAHFPLQTQTSTSPSSSQKSKKTR